MISEKLKIDFNNLKFFEEYNRLLSNARQASSALDSAIHSSNGYDCNVQHNQLFKKVELNAKIEEIMLYNKINIWNLEWSKVDKNNVISVGDYYKTVSYNTNGLYKDEKVCTLFHILKIEYPDNIYEVPSSYEGQVTVFYESIYISPHYIRVTDQDINNNNEYAHNEHTLLEPFVANVISGKYQKIQKDEWNKALSFYDESMRIYNHFVVEENGEAEK